MRLATLTLLGSLLAVASAHFQLQYPAPRGVFVEDEEPNFCDGYTESTTNRTTFPLNGGVITFNSEHPSWTMGISVSTLEDANTFTAFNTSGGVVTPFFADKGEGVFCLPLDLGAHGIAGIADGANVSLQFTFSGGDGQLYQCADLTLSADATVPASVACSNATGSTTTTAASASASSSTSTTSGAARVGTVTGFSGAVVVAAVFAML